MIWSLVRKELLTNLLTYRLSIALVFTIVLSALTTVIGSLDYSRNVASYEDELRNQRELIEQVTIYERLSPTIILPPQPLAIFARGVVGVAPLSYDIRIDDYGRGPEQLFSNRDSGYMKALIQIDFITVVTVLLSFLAIVLGFDGICGERERGTLKQLLTNPIPRAYVVLAKLIGGIISLWIPFTLAFVLCLLIALANVNVVFSGDDWLRLGLLYLLTCLFLAQIFSLSLAVSAFARDTDTALIICLFAWLVGGVGYISALPSFSRYGHDEIPHQHYVDQNDEIWREWRQQVSHWEEQNPPPADAYWEGINRDGRRRFNHPTAYRWLERHQANAMGMRADNADRRYQARYGTWDPLAQEAYVVDRWSALSPFTNYQVLAYRLARTTLDDLFYAGRAGQDYRDTYIQYLRGKNAFGSQRWFTDDPPGQEPMIPQPESITTDMLRSDAPYMMERMAWAEEQQRLANDDAGRRLDLSDMPKFGGRWQRSLGDSVGTMTIGLAVLLLSFGAAVLLTVARFLRYDPQ
ncbi:MAG: ABC transporter permease subunit [Gemmatimonadetes bacterium]|nr:ABC transporter permease subunit [Gemmatimonadota bacterium]MBT4611638.1 ABC transporter permease subunit [Gemmatimonadota bacterium]MBT5057916.1 ABC transporter permease subunit [Gemmatimonadota bacterium]MBT5144356.1 ABC transporter permease subunit [Gemmatimonadota bacterium]MBT5587126.1 ABC transporter permease subunit [Gemmatimonadota bacterium]